jgi:hypothetical protein
MTLFPYTTLFRSIRVHKTRSLKPSAGHPLRAVNVVALKTLP